MIYVKYLPSTVVFSVEGPISSVFIDLIPSVPLSDSREGVISLAESSALEAGCDTSSANNHLLSVERSIIKHN